MFIATSDPAIDWLDPTARNSKRLPVKAKGLVRFRSPASLGSVGSESTPIFRLSLPLELFAPPLGHLVEDVRELLAEEDRDDRGRRLVGAQPMVVGCGRDHGAQQAAPSMHRADHRRAKNQELRVGVGSIAGIEQIALRRVTYRVVDVLARSVDARKRLFVKEASHAVFLGHSLERHHR